MFTPDEGYYFGIGAFETIAVEEGTPVFLEQHYERLQRAMEFFKLDVPMKKIEKETERVLGKPEMAAGRKVLKITVSPQNLMIDTRDNSYCEADYERGFAADYSRVRRNETSPLTYHKTLNYGDSLLEKRAAKRRGIDEPVFLNLKGALAEGACTNIFFIKGGRVITPAVSCGLLPGILREYICRTMEVEERVITPQDVLECEEMFVTNSLVGVMPVTCLGAYRFPSRKRGREILEQYRRTGNGGDRERQH